jgi:hypothetical protein
VYPFYTFCSSDFAFPHWSEMRHLKVPRGWRSQFFSNNIWFNNIRSNNIWFNSIRSLNIWTNSLRSCNICSKLTTFFP